SAGLSSTETVAITIVNAPPTATVNGAPVSSPEGTSISLTSTISDPSPADAAAGFTSAWSVTKDGNLFASGSGASYSFTPDDNAPSVVTLTATDKDGGVGTPTSTIVVTNVAPTPSIGGAPASSPEGTMLSLAASATDPSAVDTAAGLTFTWTVAKNG